jgi:outer membrane protein assembly factor BamD
LYFVNNSIHLQNIFFGMRFKTISVVVLLIALVSCNGYQKLLKSADANLKYRKALEYFGKEDYSRASELLEDVLNVFRGSNKADTVVFYLAKSNYGQGFYEAASEYYSTLFQSYPYSPFSEESEYMNAYCLYLVSPRPSLDQSNSVKSIESFQSFMKKYPASRFSKSKELIDELQDKLVDKSFYSAKLYYDIGMYKSSIVALKNSLEEYPNTKYREKLMFFVLNSRYLLAVNSIEIKKKERFQEAVDEYYSFISEFPKSEYKADADFIYQNSQESTK